jgi:hypothetical protein
MPQKRTNAMGDETDPVSLGPLRAAGDGLMASRFMSVLTAR